MPVLLAFLGMQGNALAAPSDHVLPLQEMERRIAGESKQRRANLGKLNEVLSMSRVEDTLRSANLDPKTIRSAASLLSDEELAKLAARAESVRTDIEAGALSNQELTYIVIALVTALVVVIIFVA